MLHFKHPSDLSQLPSSDPAHSIIKSLVDLTITPYDTPDRPYDPDGEGWIVLIQEDDLVGPLTDIWDDTSLHETRSLGNSQLPSRFPQHLIKPSPPTSKARCD